MSQYVGFDVSVKEVSICVVKAAGDVLARTAVAADPDLIAGFIAENAPGPGNHRPDGAKAGS